MKRATHPSPRLRLWLCWPGRRWEGGEEGEERGVQEVEGGDLDKSAAVRKAAELKAQAQELRSKAGENQLSKYREECAARLVPLAPLAPQLPHAEHDVAGGSQAFALSRSSRPAAETLFCMLGHVTTSTSVVARIQGCA